MSIDVGVGLKHPGGFVDGRHGEKLGSEFFEWVFSAIGLRRGSWADITRNGLWVDSFRRFRRRYMKAWYAPEVYGSECKQRLAGESETGQPQENGVRYLVRSSKRLYKQLEINDAPARGEGTK